jgi:prevent-host-death family protein
MVKQSISYNMYEAKTKLSELVDKVRHGKEVVLTNRGKPVAMIVPIPKQPRRRKLGFLKGKGRLLPGWDSPIPDFKEYE